LHFDESKVVREALGLFLVMNTGNGYLRIMVCSPHKKVLLAVSLPIPHSSPFDLLTLTESADEKYWFFKRFLIPFGAVCCPKAGNDFRYTAVSVETAGIHKASILDSNRLIKNVSTLMGLIFV
jgi:hypothetical protein